MNLSKKIVLGISMISICFSSNVSADQRIVTGDGEYVIDDGLDENFSIARELALKEAMRNASLSASVYVKNQSRMTDHIISEDVVEMISANVLHLTQSPEYIKDVTVDKKAFIIKCHVEAIVDDDNISKELSNGNQVELVRQNKELMNERDRLRREMDELQKKYEKATNKNEIAELRAEVKKIDVGLTAMQYIEIGNRKYKDEKYSEAIENYNRAGDALSDLPSAIEREYDNYKRAYESQENLTQTSAEFGKKINKIVVESNSILAILCNNRGLAYSKQGNLDLAIANYTGAIACNPKNSQIYVNRGIAYYKQENLSLAIEDFTKAIEINPNRSGIYYNRGIVYYDQGNLTRSIADFSKAIELDPKLPRVYYNRGIVYFNQGNLDQAIADYTKAIDLDPKFAGAYNNRGLAYEKFGKKSEAIADFQKALELNPNYEKARNNLNRLQNQN